MLFQTHNTESTLIHLKLLRQSQQLQKSRVRLLDLGTVHQKNDNSD